MSERNHWLDEKVRDNGTYRHVPVNELDERKRTTRQVCNKDDYEDILIDALDAGLTSEEIADILLGST